MSISTCIIDSREPAWVQKLRFGSAMTMVNALDFGDLLATTDDGVMIAVERKTTDDLLGSIKDGRIWPQLVGLRASTPWAYVVVCGTLAPSTAGRVVTDRGETGWNWSSVQGALLRAQELGVFVTFAATDDAYEETVIALSARDHLSETVIAPAKTGVLMNTGEQILASLPGIGMDKVSRLLSYTGRPCWALSFLTNLDAHERVPGIGPGTKTRIREALGLAANEELSVILNNGQVAENELKKASGL